MVAYNNEQVRFQDGNNKAVETDEVSERLLPEEFTPGKFDVICQRGKECFDHVGNRKFRTIINNQLDKYISLQSRQQKSKLVASIVKDIRELASECGGGFVRKDLITRRWFKVTNKLAREKVGQALRDAIKSRRSCINRKATACIKDARMKEKQRTQMTPWASGCMTYEEEKISLEMPAAIWSAPEPLHRSNEARESTMSKIQVEETPSYFDLSIPQSPNFYDKLVDELEPTPIVDQKQSSHLFDLYNQDFRIADSKPASTSWLGSSTDDKPFSLLEPDQQRSMGLESLISESYEQQALPSTIDTSQFSVNRSFHSLLSSGWENFELED